jgi:cystathionine gamma-synthase
MRLETIAVHAGAEIDSTTGALAPPLHLSTTFEHGPAAEAIHEFLYIREKNPTQSRLEAALRDLEGGAAALVFSSGMAAAAAVLQTLAPGSHVVFSDDIYIDVRNLVRDFLSAWRVESTEEDLQDLQVLKAAIRLNTKLVWIETPSNPLMKVLDISLSPILLTKPVSNSLWTIPSPALCSSGPCCSAQMWFCIPPRSIAEATATSRVDASW